MILLEKNLLGPLHIGQVSFKSYLSGKKIQDFVNKELY